MSYGLIDTEQDEEKLRKKKHRKLLREFQGKGAGTEILQKVREREMTVSNATKMIRRLISASWQVRLF